jgi:hypothetical protein
MFVHKNVDVQKDSDQHDVDKVMAPHITEALVEFELHQRLPLPMYTYVDGKSQ